MTDFFEVDGEPTEHERELQLLRVRKTPDFSRVVKFVFVQRGWVEIGLVGLEPTSNRSAPVGCCLRWSRDPWSDEA